MKYLLDTNIISETIKKAPNKQVISWLSQVKNEDLYISVITLGEIRRGIEKTSDKAFKLKLITWLENDLTNWFEKRILPIDINVADKWGYLTGNYKIPAIDGLIAAIALVHNLRLVTRNTSDFQMNGLEVINPWNN